MSKVFLDKIPSTAHIESVIAAEPLKNGQFVELGVLSDEDFESREGTKAKDNASADVLLVDAPISYGDPHFDLDTYELAAGKAGRGYHLVAGDIISVTEDLVHGAKVGEYVAVNADGLGFATAVDKASAIAQVIGTESHGFDGDVAVVAFV